MNNARKYLVPFTVRNQGNYRWVFSLDVNGDRCFDNVPCSGRLFNPLRVNYVHCFNSVVNKLLIVNDVRGIETKCDRNTVLILIVGNKSVTKGESDK